MKKYDICVKAGSYVKDGQTKNRYQQVGVVLEKDGKPFILLNRNFNPAGVANSDSKDTVLLSLFEPKTKQSKEEPIDMEWGE